MNQKTKFIFLSIIFFGFFGLAQASYAADYYVSPTGAAAWANCGAPAKSGTEACPWQTAMANAVAGDTVYFRGGTYDVGVIGSNRWQANMRPANSGAEGNPITFKAYPDEAPIVTGTVIPGSSSAAYFGCNDVDYITWDGFSATLQIYNSGCDTETQTFGIWGGNHCIVRNSNFTGVDRGSCYNNISFVRVESGHNHVVENNYFHDLTAPVATVNNCAAVWVFGGSPVGSDTVVRNNTVVNNCGGIYGKTGVTNPHVYKNYVYNATGDCAFGLRFNYQGADGLGGGEFYQNVISGCQTGIQAGASFDASGYFIYNNTVYHTATVPGEDGILVGLTEKNISVFNNIFSGFERLADIQAGATFTYWNNNIYYLPPNGNWTWDTFSQGGNWTHYSPLSAWISFTGLDGASFHENPQFANPGGSHPEDYKINSAHKNSGRGGSYASVMGAYITSDETIGYMASGGTSDIIPPAAPSGLSVQ